MYELMVVMTANIKTMKPEARQSSRMERRGIQEVSPLVEELWATDSF